MRIDVRTFLIALAAALLAGGHAIAHHSFAAEFDAEKPVTLKGTVVKWEMINPHGWITMDVTGPDGKTLQWMVETSNPNGLMRLGWTKRSLKAGDEITVEGFRAKDGSNTANAARVTLADGRKVFAGSAGTPAGNAVTVQTRDAFASRSARLRRCACCRALRTDELSSQRAEPGGAAQASGRTPRPAGPVDEERRRISGPVRRLAGWDEFRGGGGRGGGARAGAARQRRGTNTRRRPKRSERTGCGADTRIPRRVVISPAFRERSISRAGSIRCRSFRTRSTWRCSTKPCTTSASFPPTTATHPRNYWAWDGDSRGRWEGDTLVVDVSNFNGRTWLDMAGNFVDENEHVVERFTLIDPDTILYEATITDPTVFVKPVQMRFTLKRVPAEQQILEYSCLEGERSLQHYTEEDGGTKQRAK